MEANQSVIMEETLKIVLNFARNKEEDITKENILKTITEIYNVEKLSDFQKELFDIYYMKMLGEI